MNMGIMFLILWIMAYTNNMAMLVMEVLGFFVLGALNIVAVGRMFGEASVFAISFLVIAIAIMIFKLSTKRESG